MVYNRWSWKVIWILARYGKGQFWKLDKLIADNSEAQNGCPVTYVYLEGTGPEAAGSTVGYAPWMRAPIIFSRTGFRTTCSTDTSKSGISAGCRSGCFGLWSGAFGWHLVTVDPRRVVSGRPRLPRFSPARRTDRRSRRRSSPARRAAECPAPSPDASGSACCRCCGRSRPWARRDRNCASA